MKIELSAKIKNPRIVIGFPGFGLVGTIATEFLTTHLKTEKIGRILLRESSAMIAVHKNEILDPISLYYDKDHNLLFVHAISAPHKLEWVLSERILALARQVDAKEILCLEGVGGGKDASVFYVSQNYAKKKIEECGVKPLEEGVVIGVSAAILSTTKIPLVCLFAETKTDLPDSKAAASLIKVLDKYLGLDVDYKPLLLQAQEFEEKLKSLLTSSQKVQEQTEKKWMNYVG